MSYRYREMREPLDKQRFIAIVTASNILHSCIAQVANLSSVACKLARVQMYLSNQKWQ
jgi:hypothetical protein